MPIGNVDWHRTLSQIVASDGQLIVRPVGHQTARARASACRDSEAAVDSRSRHHSEQTLFGSCRAYIAQLVIEFACALRRIRWTKLTMSELLANSFARENADNQRLLSTWTCVRLNELMLEDAVLCPFIGRLETNLISLRQSVSWMSSNSSQSVFASAYPPERVEYPCLIETWKSLCDFPVVPCCFFRRWSCAVAQETMPKVQPFHHSQNCQRKILSP